MKISNGVKKYILFSIILVSTLWFFSSATAEAATYYIDYNAANDSANGTTKSTPWKRSPGMTGFAGSYSHSAGDQFIFKGGVTWPAAAMPLTISYSGSSGNSDYYGVDLTWYAGGSWTRPIFDLELTPGKKNAISVSTTVSNITIDNIEAKNLVIDNNNGKNALININSSYGCDGIMVNILIKNCYIHKWTRTAGFTRDTNQTDGGITNLFGCGLTVQDSIIDNSEGCRDCGALLFAGEYALRNTVSWAPQGINGYVNVIGNHISNITNCFDPASHENVLYMKGEGIAAYNIIHGMEKPTFHGVVIYVDPSWGLLGSLGGLYVYGNVIYDTSSQVPILFQNERTSNIDPHIYFWNNTVMTNDVEVCGRVSGNIHHLELRNNHWIQRDTWNGVWYNGHRGEGYVSVLVDDHNLMMTPTVATIQGYVVGNNYAPTSGSKSTVNIGTALACVSCVPSVALDILGVSRPQGLVWDIGAYEYSGGGPTPINGQCGTTLNTCTSGTLNDTADSAAEYLWQCLGSNGGSTASCSVSKPAATYTLTVSKAGTGSGTVTGTGISCGSDCSETINSGTSVTLTAAANSGSTFAGWSGGGCSGTGSCTVTVSSNITVTATFNLTSDTQAPTIPTNLSATAISSSQINLSWTASTDNVGVTGYRIYRAGTQIGTSVNNSYSNTGLTANTTYSYTVSAYDTAGNNSSQSSSASATTQAASVSGNIEAESGTLTSPMQIVTDSAASGNAYIMTQTGESGTAVYSFNIASTGTYKIVARVYAQNGGTDSFYVKVDNLSEDTWDLNPSETASDFNAWREDEVTKRGTGTVNQPQYDPYTIQLSQGNHTITFRGREINAKLDYFRLVRISGPTSKRGDLNNDNRVDVMDLGIFLSNWNSTSRPPSDINQDGKVDVIDLGILLSNWG